MPRIELTDGVTTITLTDGVTYALREGGWAPRVAQLSRATLGGAPYTDVEESIGIDVFGATPGELGLLARLQGIQALLLQASRWAEGEQGVRPVLLRYLPDGTARAADEPLQAIVLGPAGGTELPDSLNDYAVVREVEGATVGLLRRGPWLPELTQSTAASASGSSHTLFALSYTSGAVPYPSPTLIFIEDIPGSASSATRRNLAGLLLISDQPGAIQVVEAESSQYNYYEDQADPIAVGTSTAPLARGGQVLSLGPGGGYFTFGLTAFPGAALQIYAVCRNITQTDADIAVTGISAGLSGPISNLNRGAFAGDPTPIPSATRDPQVVALPPVPVPIFPGAAQNIWVELRVTGAAEVEIDYLVCTALERTAAIAHDAARVGTGLHGVVFDPRADALPDGDVRVFAVSGGAFGNNPALTSLLGARGSTQQLFFSGGALSVMYLAPLLGCWCLPTTAGTAAASVSVRARRRRVYLIPE